MVRRRRAGLAYRRGGDPGGTCRQHGERRSRASRRGRGGSGRLAGYRPDIRRGVRRRGGKRSGNGARLLVQGECLSGQHERLLGDDLSRYAEQQRLKVPRVDQGVLRSCSGHVRHRGGGRRGGLPGPGFSEDAGIRRVPGVAAAAAEQGHTSGGPGDDGGVHLARIAGAGLCAPDRRYVSAPVVPERWRGGVDDRFRSGGERPPGAARSQRRPVP